LYSFDDFLHTPIIPFKPGKSLKNRLSLFGVFEFFDFGQVLEGGQSEDLEELFGGAVEHGAAEDFGAADDFDQSLEHEAAEDFAAGDAADGLDVGADDRLLVADDGQGLEGGGESLLSERTLMSLVIQGL
jgi:hypothetical protein